jgi:PAS domain S-box-containing protein
MGLSPRNGANDQGQISLGYLTPTPRQTRAALSWAAALLLGLGALAPFAAKPLPQFNGFIPALDAIIFVTDLITAGLLFSHFSITRSRALLALACGYLLSALLVAIHGITFPEAFSQGGDLGRTVRINFRIYLFWHLCLPAASFVYVWFRDKDRIRVAGRVPIVVIAISSVVGVLALVSCIVWLAAVADIFLPSPPNSPPLSHPFASRLIYLTMLICAGALCALWVFRRSVLDQWLMIVMLTSIIELAITGRLGFHLIDNSPGFESRFTLGFYTGRTLFSLITSTVVLAALLAETTRLYAGVARANILASTVDASQALSGEIELPNLIKRLMKIALESTGADRGLLILPEGQEYLIRAEAQANADQVEVTMRQDLVTEASCPISLVRRVIRTQKSVVLDDTSKYNPYSADDYPLKKQSKSILCLPLIKQQELTGVLFLENTLTSHSFTPARSGVLELLAAQAAISIENTRLYSDLQERESKVRRLVDSNIIGICVYNLDRRILEANDAFLSMVEYSRDDVISGRLTFSGLTPPEWAEDDKRRLADLVSTGTWKPSEKEFFRKDGSRVPVLIGSATFGESRRQGVAFVVDLTERKRAEAELAHANRVATMGELTASIAHEVNQPLAALITNAEAAVRWLARQPPNFEKARPLIDHIIDDGNRAIDVIGRIRDLSKKRPIKLITLEINETIVGVVALTRAVMSEHNVRSKMQLSEGLPSIFGDKVQLQQVILNLIMNAIEAMGGVSGRSRDLLISTSKAEPDGVMIAVGDTGPGLPQANPERVFKSFYTTKANGLGMGLSICRSIVEAHGGRLWAKPNEPHGAVFCMMLPIAAREK